MDKAYFLIDYVHVQQILERTQTSYTYLVDSEADHMCIGDTKGLAKSKSLGILENGMNFTCHPSYPHTYLSQKTYWLEVVEHNLYPTYVLSQTVQIQGEFN